MADEKTKSQCPDCERMVLVNKDGNLRKHPWCAPMSDPAPTVVESRCDDQDCVCGGDGVEDVEEPFEEPQSGGPEKGPWFGAMYDGRCDSCHDTIFEGDRIRADGQGGYECADCGGHPWAVDDELRSEVKSDWQAQASAAAKRAMQTLSAGAPSYDMAVQPFELNAVPPLLAIDPSGPNAQAVVVDAPAAPEDPFETLETVVEEPKLNVSGQPPARRDYLKRYVVVDPDLGDFRRAKNGNPQGLTRATTFNKAASSTIRLGEWKARNIVIGASRSPDILLSAHGLTHDAGRDELNRIAARLEEVAGAKVGSELGTYLHSFTELMDAGLKTWQDAPQQFQGSLMRYEEALRGACLEPVPGLIERTTMIREYGGIVGTFDRIFYHRPSGQYVIGDLKTGKTMDYARTETDTQLWIYAHGVNQNGIYDWNTDTWCPPGSYGDSLETGPWSVPTVSEDLGVIIHMPVQDKLAGQVILEAANLNAGWNHADLCAANRSAAKPKARPWTEWAPKPVYTPPARDWDAEFRCAGTGEKATALWREAKAAGVAGVRLNELIELARESIREARVKG